MQLRLVYNDKTKTQPQFPTLFSGCSCCCSFSFSATTTDFSFLIFFSSFLLCYVFSSFLSSFFALSFIYKHLKLNVEFIVRALVRLRFFFVVVMIMANDVVELITKKKKTKIAKLSERERKTD